MTVAQKIQKTTRGRPFQKGNGGRPRGSKNRSTQILATVSPDDQAQILRKGVELAKAGDPILLRFFLARMIPKDRLIHIDLPVMGFADDAAETIAAIMRAVCDGKITPEEGTRLATIATLHSRALETADLIERLDQIEAKLPDRGGV
jgi:hypothetical protein